MSRDERATWMLRARTVSGLAAAVVPFAIFVHLFAEALSLGRDALGSAFLVRHVYLGVIFAATAIWFGRTVGVGSRPAERRRRCALIKAHVRGAAGSSVAALLLAHVLFFALSQLIEGVPIASGDFGLGLAAALLGSFVSALVVFIFGRSLVGATLTAIFACATRAATPGLRHAMPRAIIPRRASAPFSLFVPNRPPPAPFLA